MQTFDIIFDNGGGATLQVNGMEYVHNYYNMTQLAEDVRALVGGADVSDWEGNEPWRHADAYWRHAQNGGYRALDQDTWQDDHTDNSWHNMRAFSRAARA